MSSSKNWVVFDAESVSTVPDTAGVYQLADQEKNIVYIAGVPNLRQGLEESLTSGESVRLEDARLFRYEEAFMYSVRESELIQRFIREKGRMPRGNQEMMWD